jgi:hypothetical protein
VRQVVPQLACQDLDAVLRLFLALSAEASTGDPAAFLAAGRERAEALLASKKRAKGDSHPELPVRAFAAWLFAQSDVYHRLTGRGRPVRSLLDVDMVVASLVGPSDDAILPFDEPTWMDGVGEAIYERSGALGRAIGSGAARLAAGLGRSRVPSPGCRQKVTSDEAPDIEAPDLDDDLEARFAALERSMSGDGR